MFNLPVLALLLSAAPAPLTTVAEQSGWVRTGRYDEVIRLCHAFPARYAGRVRCTQFGTTPEGRPMLALVASDDGVLSPEQAHSRKRPVVLFQGGIHAGEIDGKDAGFWLLRDLLDHKTLPGALKALTFVFVPVFNVDGHERFGPNQRPNQNGPESMGWRVTAQNLNLNRDYLKDDAPEMTAMLGLLHAWDPILYGDLHVTDGAQFQHDVAVLLEGPRDAAAVDAAAQKLHDDFFPRINGEKKHLALDFYPMFEKEPDPSSGFAVMVPPPRFSQRYWALHHRLGVLVETHSWKDYATRVRTTYDVMEVLLGLLAHEGASIYRAEHEADAAVANAIPQAMPLTWKNSAKRVTVDFQGYAYRMEKDSLSGKAYPVYDVKTPQVWKESLAPEVVPDATVPMPRAGYIVPAAFASWVAPKLTAHGVAFSKIPQTATLQVQTFRATSVKQKPTSYEGHQETEITGEWKPESREVPAGSLFVPLAQPAQLVITNLFEPVAPDSLVRWGFFNAAFEQKEYIEPYVLEPWAKELLAKDPAVKAEWESKLKDPAFANDPEARLKFFASRHPAWDERLGLYPVYRVDQAPVTK